MALTEESALRKDRTMPSGMAMQHRHFAVIADIINDMRRRDDSESNFQADRVARHFATRLRATNSKFDHSRFLRACGVAGE